MADYLIDGLPASSGLVLTDLVETQTPGSGGTQKSTLAQVQSALGVTKNNFAATVAPTVTDDSAAGYSAGSSWMNAATGEMWRCRSAAAGAARWVKMDVSDHPGYVAGRWYLPFGIGAQVAGVAPATAGTFYMFLGVIKERITISQLGVRISTVAAGGSFQLGLYSHNPDTGRPALLLGKTVSGSTATAGGVNVALEANVTVEPGNYWFTYQSDSTTAFPHAVGSSSPNHASLIGSASSAIASSPTTTPAGYAITGSSFGTWPADLSSSSPTELANGRAYLQHFLVASVP